MIQDIKPKRVDYKLYPYDSAETEPFYILERSDGVLLKISESVNSILEIMDGEKSLKEVRDILEDQHGLLLEIGML